MSYKKEIDFMLNGEIEIEDFTLSSWIENEGDYDYADLRYRSRIKTSKYDIDTNLGNLYFIIKTIELKYEEHDGELNEWIRAEKLDKIDISIDLCGIEDDIVIDKEQYDLISHFLSNIEDFDSKKSSDENEYHPKILEIECQSNIFTDEQINEEYYPQNFYDSEEEYLQAIDNARKSNSHIVKATDFPSIFLNRLIEKNSKSFQDLNIQKLKELIQAKDNTSMPEEFLNKVNVLSPSAQTGTVYFATKKSKEEVDKLISKEVRQHDPYESYGY